MKTFSTLIKGADQQADNCGEDQPGAEHFLLSALELPDGSARRVFERVGVSPMGSSACVNRLITRAYPWMPR